MNLELYRPQIEAALKHAGKTHNFEHILAGVQDGRFQAWVNGESIAICEIVVYPLKKSLNVFIAGGKSKELVEMLKSAEEWGRNQGCSKITFAGRKGWLRYFKKSAFKQSIIFMEKSI